MNNELDRQIPSYSASFLHYEENRIVHVAYGHRIADHVREVKARTVLSLGIGHSEVSRPLIECLVTRAMHRYAIVDASHELVEAFRRELEPLPQGLELIEGWFETFETEGVFDVIEAGFILEHVDDPAAIMRRMHRFLAPGGRMFVAVPNACSLHRLVGFHAGLLKDMHALSDADRSLGHQRYFDLPMLQQLVVAAGWQVVQARGMLLKPFTTGQMGKLDLPEAVWNALRAVAVGYPEISNAIEMEIVAAA